MNDRSPGYEPDGISWLPHLAMKPPNKAVYLMFVSVQNSFFRNIRSSIFPLTWIFLRTYARIGLRDPSMSP